MTKILTVLVLTLVTASLSFASDADSAGPKTKRVRCENSTSFDPYLRVRGSLMITEQNEAQGTLTVETGSFGGQRVLYEGSYYKGGSTEFADLQDSRDPMNRMYIDFTDTGLGGRSYIETLKGFQRMTCKTI
jgi:hypothetical protein